MADLRSWSTASYISNSRTRNGEPPTARRRSVSTKGRERAMNLGNGMRLAWDRAAAVALIAAGAVALVLGYVGVSGEAFPAKQLPYLISGGIAGVFVLGVGALFWLSADMRDEW